MNKNKKYLKIITTQHYDTIRKMIANIECGLDCVSVCRGIECDKCPFDESNHIDIIDDCMSYDNIKGGSWDDMNYVQALSLLKYMLTTTSYAEFTDIRQTKTIDVNSIKENKQQRTNKWLENYIKLKLKPVDFIIGEDNYSIMWDLSNHSFKAMKANYSKHFLQVHLDNSKGQVEQACRDFNDKNIKPQQVIDIFKKLNYFKEEM